MSLCGIAGGRRGGVLGVGVAALLAASSVFAPSPASAIVGGELAKHRDAPWQVSVQQNGWNGWAHHCGGSIIDAATILTAAHCVQGAATKDLRVGYGNLKHSQTTPVAVTAVRVHEKYKATKYIGLTSYAFDLAILKLAHPIPLHTGSPDIGTVKLAYDGSDLAKGDRVTATGWGTTKSGGAIPADLYKVSVPVVDRPTCNTAYAQYGGVGDDLICGAEEEGGKDRCKGDDGGPLVKVDGSTATLEGIVSWGYGCAVKGYPGVYTRVGYLRHWIDTHRK